MSMLSPGDRLTYVHPNGDTPAELVCTYGLRLIVRVKHWGKPALRYVEPQKVRPHSDSNGAPCS